MTSATALANALALHIKENESLIFQQPASSPAVAVVRASELQQALPVPPQLTPAQQAIEIAIDMTSMLVRILLLAKLTSASPKVQMDAQTLVTDFTTLGEDVATGQ